ncbi:hypothetical protein I5M27_11735 [Adhaeribacter sp. BT258]|uniref:Lipoprotein n=1 Tax=Adhaeribacter terrigena TaxID=2793070 RepID=A0ABS1C2N6_9BACT|nr:hypothetical protein [Adhaeribacter terrigena]MBK0403660.1 hypothetical protein [Adhaeribacter terrigena]
MNKSLLVAFAFAGILSACSSQPSDFRPGNKVSVNEVAPGTRETDIYNLNGQVAPHPEHGHEATGHQTTGPDAGGTNTTRPDVMLNADEHKSDIGGKKQVPAEEKTTDAEQVENHQ